jgi:serine incorporator 1/3
VLAWLVLVFISFLIPNEFFLFWGNYIALIGSTAFILIGLVLLVDFAHSWSEKCLQNWQETDSALWKWILIGSTMICYIFFLVITILDYVYFSPSGCGLNTFFITFNLILCLGVSILSVTPAIQEANYKSGLSQSGMVAAYCTYLITSAVANHDSDKCNPLNSSASTARTSMIVVGAVFTFLAIAYSTSRAATQSKALAGKKRRGDDVMNGGYGRLRTTMESHEELTTVNGNKDDTRRQALLAAVAAG